MNKRSPGLCLALWRLFCEGGRWEGRKKLPGGVGSAMGEESGSLGVTLGTVLVFVSHLGLLGQQRLQKLSACL